MPRTSHAHASCRTACPVLLRTLLGAVLLSFLISRANAADLPRLDAAYPGGNIIVEKVQGDTYFLKPDQRDTQKGQWWFYWNFRVIGAAGRTLHFRFTGQNPIGVRGPAISRDAGETWSWLGAAAVKTLAGKPQAWEFSYHFESDAEVRFCFAIPYMESHLRHFLDRHRGDPALLAGELCKTKKGRSVECLRLGKVSGEPKYRVLLTARHHACESLADYAMEGIMETILSDTPEGRAWRQQVEVMAIPFMDKDGVEDGDQGKYRAPRDHNRDYSGQSIHPSTAALRRLAPEWSQGKLVFALDLHCPHIRGGTNEHIYFVGSQDQAMWRTVGAFSRQLEATRTGPLPYHEKGNVPYGTAWNTASNTTAGKSFGQWARELPGIHFASSLEIPYANVQGTEMTADAARALGHDLARTILYFLTH